MGGQGEVHRRAQTIDVRPVALQAVLLVLLRRRVAFADEDGLARIGVVGARAAEIQQNRGIAALEDDVGGLYIPVDDFLLVQHPQILDERLHHPHQLLRRDCALFAHPMRQRFALDVRHHQIRGIVFLEQIQHLHHRRAARGFQQHVVFRHELIAPVGEQLGIIALRDDPAVIASGGNAVRKVLLHRHHFAAHGIDALQLQGAVGRAESPAAQRRAKQILPMQDGLRRQRIANPLCILRFRPAHRADGFLRRHHAARAGIGHRHVASPPRASFSSVSRRTACRRSLPFSSPWSYMQ